MSTTLEVFLIDAVRTPVGRYGGALSGVRPDDLAAHVIKALCDRTAVPPDAIDDVLLGCANQAGEDNRNVARMALLLAGLPVTVPGATVNRLCGSGMMAVADAARLIRAGDADLVIAGGVESMSRAPLVMGKAETPFARGNQTLFDSTLGWRFVNPRLEALHGVDGLGETAEKVAEKYVVSRAAQDAFALRSQRHHAAARAAGRFAAEIVPIDVAGDRGTSQRVEHDEHPRPGTTAEELAALRPAFRKQGTVTAGNSSGLNDGAAALLLASAAGLARLTGDRSPLAGPYPRIVASAVAGLEPSLMGLGPIPATRKLFARTGLTAAEIDRIELNEAFAAQALPCIAELGFDPDRVNVNGGAIAIGHPIGCTGARLVTTLAHELHRGNHRRGLATMCIGVGQGMSLLLERG